MVGVALMLGIVGFMFVLAYIAFNLRNTDDGNNHFLLQLLILLMIAACVITLGKAVMDVEQPCDFLVVNQTGALDNFTSFEYDYVCENTGSNTGLIFYKMTLWFSRLFLLYMFVYVTYEGLKFAGLVVPKDKE